MNIFISFVSSFVPILISDFQLAQFMTAYLLLFHEFHKIKISLSGVSEKEKEKKKQDRLKEIKLYSTSTKSWISIKMKINEVHML